MVIFPGGEAGIKQRLDEHVLPGGFACVIYITITVKAQKLTSNNVKMQFALTIINTRLCWQQLAILSVADEIIFL